MSGVVDTADQICPLVENLVPGYIEINETRVMRNWLGDS
jgi:hypothetical protein